MPEIAMDVRDCAAFGSELADILDCLPKRWRTVAAGIMDCDAFTDFFCTAAVREIEADKTGRTHAAIAVPERIAGDLHSLSAVIRKSLEPDGGAAEWNRPRLAKLADNADALLRRDQIGSV